MTAIVELCQVDRTYAGHPPIHALSDVTLRVDPGELVAVVGASGSGKSTLLNIMGTLDRPTGGRILFDGVDVIGLSDAALAGLRSARLGFVFQQFHLLPGVSALDNVATGALYSKIPRGERRERAMIALRRVGLAHRATHDPSALSGGESQRVAIARALVADPGLVLADEPTGNLDSTTSREIVDVLRQLHSEGTTIVVITHDRELAAALPRQVGISDGHVAFDRRAATETTSSGDRHDRRADEASHAVREG